MDLFLITLGCHRNIREFTKESKLLDSNLKMLDEIEVFPDETLKDIVEPYDEEYEAHWRGKSLSNEIYCP